MGEPAIDVDLNEKGRSRDGRPNSSDRRLFIQLLAFGGCTDIEEIVDAVDEAALPGVVYEDVNDPYGIAVLSYSEDPARFLSEVHPLMRREPFRSLLPKPEYTMLGRTYSMGYEADLEETLIERPKSRLCNSELSWAVWYPLRRSGAFAALEEAEQRAILAEHGSIGHAFGKVGHGYDIRLACHGLSKDDNDFVIGLLGRELFPLSAIVQRMRRTRQTSQYLTHLGPFFVGRVVHQPKAELA